MQLSSMHRNFPGGINLGEAQDDPPPRITLLVKVDGMYDNWVSENGVVVYYAKSTHHVTNDKLTWKLVGGCEVDVLLSGNAVVGDWYCGVYVLEGLWDEGWVLSRRTAPDGVNYPMPLVMFAGIPRPIPYLGTNLINVIKKFR